MKIKIKADANSGAVAIPSGEYWVALRPETKEFALVARGKDIMIPAIRRLAQTRSKTTTVIFYSGGGTSWSLVVSVPKHGEWIALIDYGKKSVHSNKEKSKKD